MHISRCSCSSLQSCFVLKFHQSSNRIWQNAAVQPARVGSLASPCILPLKAAVCPAKHAASPNLDGSRCYGWLIHQASRGRQNEAQSVDKKNTITQQRRKPMATWRVASYFKTQHLLYCTLVFPIALSRLIIIWNTPFISFFFKEKSHSNPEVFQICNSSCVSLCKT